MFSGIRASDHKVCDARENCWERYVQFVPNVEPVSVLQQQKLHWQLAATL